MTVVGVNTPPPEVPPEGGVNLLGMVKSCAANVQARMRPAMPSLEEIRDSPHYPVVVTLDPSQVNPGVRYNGSDDLTARMPINGGIIEWENDIWKGRVMINLRGLPTSDGSLFAGKKRFSWGVAQGRFKVPIKAKDLAVGQEVEVPVRGPSEPIIQWVVTQIAHNFSQTCEVDVHAEHPYFLNPLLAACQVVNVARPGEEPQDLIAAHEDCRLLHPDLVSKDGSPLAADKRRRWCDTPANVQDLELSTELVYTFGWWQHFFDLSTYRVHVGPFVALDLCPFLCAQPIQIFFKHTATNTALLSMLVWHERLLYPEEAGKGKPKAKAAKAGDGEEADGGKVQALSERFRGLLAGWRA